MHEQKFHEYTYVVTSILFWIIYVFLRVVCIFGYYALFVHFVHFRMLFAFCIFLHISVSYQHTKLVALIFNCFFFSFSITIFHRITFFII